MLLLSPFHLLCCVVLQEGNADAGRYQLETALDVLYRQTGGHNMEVVAADYHFKLGRYVHAATAPAYLEQVHTCSIRSESCI